MGFTSFEQVDRLTFPEYNLMMKAVELRRVDEEYRIHWQAYLNQAVKSTKGKKDPKPIYKRFEKFFDYDKALEAVMDEREEEPHPDRFAALKAHMREGEN